MLIKRKVITEYYTASVSNLGVKTNSLLHTEHESEWLTPNEKEAHIAMEHGVKARTVGAGVQLPSVVLNALIAPQEIRVEDGGKYIPDPAAEPAPEPTTEPTQEGAPTA